jgi:HD-like signal output (HDOD) protein
VFGFLFKNKPHAEPSAVASNPEVSDTTISGPTSDETVFKIKADTAPSIGEVDTKFMGMMMGINSLVDDDLSSNAKKALENIKHWSQQKPLPDNLVPRLPSIVPKIMMAVRNDNSTAQDMADLISEDISLVGEVIRLSNSAFYRTGEKIESLKQAIVKLGMNGIRQLVSSAAFKPILNSDKGNVTSVLGKYLWEKNQKAAMAANLIAMHTEDDRFHAYLTGLLNQTGMLVIIKKLEENFNAQDIPRTSEFMHELDMIGKSLTVQISRQWEMPEEVTRALEDQLNEQAPVQISSLGSVCYIADKLAKMSILEAKGQLHGMDQGLHCDVNKIKGSLCNQCYEFINLDRASN